MSGFSVVLEYLFSWLPGGLWTPVWAVISVAFFIVLIKVVIALVEIISKVIFLFL